MVISVEVEISDVVSVVDVDCELVDSVEDVGTGGVKTLSSGFGSVQTKWDRDFTFITTKNTNYTSHLLHQN